MKSLPKGWTPCKLACVGLPRTQKVAPQDTPGEIFENWSVPNFPNGPELVLGSEIKSSKQLVEPGDVLLCKINPRLNRVEYVEKPIGNYRQIASTEWIVVRTSRVDPKFLVFALRNKDFREKFLRDVSGVGGSLMRARPTAVQKIDIYIAPFNEQRRIVAKIEALQARSRRAREALEAVAPLLEKFRQSVLTAAFRGDLTADWRAKNPNVEPASKLLERIRIERRRRWEEAELANGKRPKNDSWKCKYREPAPIFASSLPELPEGWCWATLDETIDPARPISYGILKPGPYVEAGIPMLRIVDIKGNAIDSRNVHRVSEKLSNQYGRTILSGGEVVISLVGTVGLCALIPHSLAGANVHRNLGVVVLGPSLRPGFLSQFMVSPNAQRQIGMRTRGANQALFNLADLKTVAVPVPPTREQEIIETRIAKHFARYLCQNKLIANADDLISSLDESILAHAFRGKLVSQNPDDESALVLLDRIRVDQSKENKTKRSGSKIKDTHP